MIPGLGGMADKLGAAGEDPERELKRVDGIINSMTEYERENPTKIDRSRRNRIAAGCGVEPSEVNALLKQFGEMATMMKRMSGMGAMDRMRAVQEIARNSDPSGNFKVQKQRSKRGPQSSDKQKELKKKQRKDKKKARKRNK